MKKYFSSYWIRSGFFNFLQRFSVQLFGVLNLMIIVRMFSDEKSKMGTWALFGIVTTLFEVTKTGLLKNAHIKYVNSNNSEIEKSAIASSSFIINLLITGAFILFILFFSGDLSLWLNAGKDLSNMLIWFIPGLLFMVFFSHFEAVQQSYLEFKGVFAGYFSRQLSFFLIIFFHFIFNLSFTLTDLVIYQTISIIVGTITQYLYTRKFLMHLFNPTKIFIKKILGYGGYIFGTGIIGGLFPNIDSLMTAGLLTNNSYVAYYNVANRVNGVVDMPVFVAADIIFPKSAKAIVEDGIGKVKYLYERMVAVLFFITTPVSLLIIFFPQLILKIIAGSGYQASAFILQLYMISGIFRPMQNQAANLLNSIGKARLVFFVNLITIAFNLIADYICFRIFGFYGTAIGTCITSLLAIIGWYFIMKKQVGFETSGVFRHMSQLYKFGCSILSDLTFRKKKAIQKKPL